MASSHGTPALRRLRLQSGLTQAELASRAGVSRQLVAAVEAGQNAPAVDAALGLARALGTTVEELFSGAADEVIPALGGRLRDGAPLRVGRVGDRLVAAELPDHGVAGAAWATPDAIVEDGTLRLFAGAAPAGLVIAGCDPAIGVAETMLQGLHARSLLAISAPTGAALRALEQGRVHAAVVHGPADELPSPPFPVIRRHFARWRVGLGVAPPLRRHSLEARVRGTTAIAQRDPAAASQRAFERAAAAAGVTPPPPKLQATGHLDAARLAATLGGAGVTTESAARAFALPFRAFEEHSVEVWYAERWHDHPGITALADVLASSSFTDRIAQIGGYDLAGCGSLLSA